MFQQAVENEMRDVAAEWGLDPAALLAVAEVESGGAALLDIDGRMAPPIRYEFHVFHRQLKPALRPGAVASGLASPRWGQFANPRSQQGRYALLDRAKSIDPEAAYAACSWGVGQVLGENARWLDYESAEALAAECCSGVKGQTDLMLRFIQRRGLSAALKARDWTAFARGYNGPLHDRNDYAGRMARAYARWASREPETTGARAARSVSGALLRPGAIGPQVEALQHALRRLGYDVRVDGVYGPRTEAAVRRAQEAAGLARDGVAGPDTWASLDPAGAGSGGDVSVDS
ncbi:N-acetylmuramidase domain-containing protein [Rubrimonas cliftonensis]|uniref:Putative peptidoglycan binding domain-containing protein n=1 Tax=Rubrimonas cliftonensis TaxID=89524 RepID=A0A1H3Z9A1_9RHOB|nr:N-acetylmuramidase domain-containing protein [Rubrimonas cliftonensis]SEA20306.1 Putative peptidoglycan binding domain-containing protein [Rubrimonas cliftonensis]